MIVLLLRLALILALLFAVALAATHARPLASGMGDLLAPSPGCSGDNLCFMGIRPGATTIPQAISLLDASTWVGELDTHIATQVSWTWSGAQPDYIDGSVPGYVLTRSYGAVSVIRFKTRYNYADVWLQLGEPPTGYALRQADGFLHGVYYPKYSLLAINFTHCPARLIDFWTLPVVIQFGDAFVLLNDRYGRDSVPLRTC
jgi:hypothetical protein